LGVGPAHDLYGANILADITAGDLDTMTTQVQNAAPAGLFLVPKPVAVRAGMGFARAGPEYCTQCAVLYTFERLDGFRRINEVFQIAVEYARFFYRFQHTGRFSRIAAERFGAKHGFTSCCGCENSLFMQIIGKG